MTFLSAQSLQDEALNAFSRSLTEIADTIAVESAIEAAEARVQNYLKRHLRIQAYTIYPGETHVGFWAWAHQRNAYAIWAPEWPVVQVEGEATHTDKRIYSPEQVSELTFYAGYGTGQTLDELQALDGLDELETAPPPLPADVHRAMVELSVLYLRPAVEGTLGGGRKTQNIGQHSVTVEGPDHQAEMRVLRRIRHHQRAV